MSVRKAQTDFYSPMTGNVFGENRRRADLIMKAAKVDMMKTDDPFTQVRERRRYYSPDDTRSITDAFDREYGVLSDEEAANILEQNQELIQQPTPVIDPEPTPTADPAPETEPTPEPENTPEEAVEVATKVKKGRSKYNDPRRVANRNKAKAMAKARKAKKSGASTCSSAGSRGGRSQGRGGARGGSTGGRGASSKGGTGSGRSSQGRGGARGGSTGGKGASSKGGTSRGGARTNRSRSRRRCDIRCKFDISLLSNINLVRDDLAELAYFVKEISN